MVFSMVVMLSVSSCVITDASCCFDICCVVGDCGHCYVDKCIVVLLLTLTYVRW